MKSGVDDGSQLVAQSVLEGGGEGVREREDSP